ncbi:MAG: hypothetical protein OEV30_10895 [Ignavibacteria bacterium]|nr:hypothetical protein [Ignavibacteria bacterium]
MIRLIILIVLTVWTVLVTMAQAPDTLWTRIYGGPFSDLSVEQTADGGFILAGHTTSFGAGDDDAWLLKTDSDGNILWAKLFGGILADQAWSVRQTSDAGYILTGETWSFGVFNTADLWLIRTDANGDTLWTRAFGSFPDERGRSVDETSDGGCIVAGWTQPSIGANLNLWLLKTDGNGDSVWTRTYGSSVGIEEGRAVRQTADGGYIVTGITSSFGEGFDDAWLLKTDTIGDTVWTKTFGGTGFDQANMT